MSSTSCAENREVGSELSEAASSQRGVSHLENPRASLRRLLQLDAAKATVALRVVYAGAAAYAGLFVFAAVVHYLAFRTGRGDLGNMVQAIWNTLHGHLLEGTTVHGHQRARLGYHVDPILLLFVPLFWIWSSPLLLVIVQALAVSSGALPVFWLARKHLDSPRAAAHFAFAYLLYPFTQFAAFTISSSFHPVALAVPLVLFAVWFLDEDRLVAFSAMALLACTTKEEIPLAIGCLGIWYAFRKRRPAVGLSIAAAGLAITLFDFLWVIPHFAPAGVNPFSGRYGAIGGTPGGIAHKLVSDPTAFVHAVATLNKSAYLVVLLVPFMGLCLLEPLVLLGAVPDLAINLLSGNRVALASERTGAVAAFVVAASIFGAARFKGRGLQLSSLALVTAALLAAAGPIRFVGGDLKALNSPLLPAKQRAINLIPKGVPVSASNELAGHLSDRRYIYVFPYIGRSKWVVVDVNDSSYVNTARFKRKVRKFESIQAWKTVFSSHEVAVFHRIIVKGS